MANATLQDDGLDTCYQMTSIQPQRRAMPSIVTVARGIGYGALVVGALAVGLLAMQPGGLQLDELFGGKAMMSGRSEGECCSLKLEIPSAVPAPESSAPESETLPDQLAAE